VTLGSCLMYWDLPSSSESIYLLESMVYIKFCKNRIERVGIDKNLVVRLRWVRMQLNLDTLMPSFRIKLEIAKIDHSKTAWSFSLKDSYAFLIILNSGLFIKPTQLKCFFTCRYWISFPLSIIEFIILELLYMNLLSISIWLIVL
jgi:hypothetical protein